MGTGGVRRPGRWWGRCGVSVRSDDEDEESFASHPRPTATAMSGRVDVAGGLPIRELRARSPVSPGASACARTLWLWCRACGLAALLLLLLGLGLLFIAACPIYVYVYIERELYIIIGIRFYTYYVLYNI